MGFSIVLTHLKQGSNTQKAKNPIPRSKTLISCIKIRDPSTKDRSKQANTNKKIY